ncbi:MAG TPA: hypothetical protein VMZ04_08345 [Anaerolineae bacterium]|nr:hypothetical protein [Anaerolineae bacterium]
MAAVQQILFEVAHCPENYETLTFRKASIEIPSVDLSRSPSRRNRCLHRQALRNDQR